MNWNPSVKCREGNKLNITDNTLSIIKEYLIKELTPHTLILFGSSVKGYFREDSDIDVAFISCLLYTSPSPRDRS